MSLRLSTSPAHLPMVAFAPEEDPLMQAAGVIAGTHVLILGGGPDLMCQMIRRGCLTAAALHLTDRPEAGEYDLVLAPSVRPEEVEPLVRQARRALVPTGRLVARGQTGNATAALGRALRLNGFSLPTAKAHPAILVADLPAFGAAFRA
jgi:hypothetical protein